MSGGVDFRERPDMYQQFMAADEEWERKYRALEAEWMGTLPPEQKAEMQRLFAERSADFDKSFKIGRALALSLIGAAAGGAALTAAGVIGAPAAAGAAGGIDSATAAAALGGAGEVGAGGAAAGAGFVGEGALSGIPLWDTVATVSGSTALKTAGGAASLLGGLGSVGDLLGTGLSVVGAVVDAKGKRDQAEEDQATAVYNAGEAEAAARNALLRGEEDARDLRRKGSLVEGAQRATFAARGLDLMTGTPRSTIEQTGFFTDEDIATSRSNAATEAATYRRQGSRFQAQASNVNPSRTGGLSLVSNLATVAARWYDRNS
jgi:hypothetical protein